MLSTQPSSTVQETVAESNTDFAHLDDDADSCQRHGQREGRVLTPMPTNNVRHALKAEARSTMTRQGSLE
ncbi:hypothetical protein CIB48_g10047 [Xylaria polymorpha]|nr:hypothetical protein CIB48_g10047 [Xylaria polymorpha]